MSLRVKTMPVGSIPYAALITGGFLLLFCLGSFLSCSRTKVVDATRHPTFTYSSAAEGVIGIAGVTSVVSDPELQAIHRCHLPALLAQSIKKVRPELGMISPERLREKVDEDKLDNIVNIYETTGELGTSTVIDLFNVSQGVARYVILARVEQDAISKDEVDIPGDDADPTSGTEYIIRRTMAVSFKVYDLEAAKQVLGTLITSDETNHRYVQDITLGGDKSFSEQIQDMMCSCLCATIFDLFQKSEDGLYPPPPEVYEVADNIFDKFAKDLPGYVSDQ
jgi:hypothetical protein